MYCIHAPAPEAALTRSNFTHLVAYRKEASHRLVKEGVYRPIYEYYHVIRYSIKSYDMIRIILITVPGRP